MHISKLFLLLSVLSNTFISSAFSQIEVFDDEKLLKEFAYFEITPMDLPKKDSDLIVELGRQLFFENELSGNRNISCSTCHHPRFGTSDELPQSIGEGGEGIGPNRSVLNGLIIPRNSPALFNLGQGDISKLFLDGRVYKEEKSNIYHTPEAALNGKNPKAKKIVAVLDSALAAQALFPMLSNSEMLGQPGSNILANSSSNLEVWKKITQRVLDIEEYKTQFTKAFPGETINIGHIGKAISAFERSAFYAINTPMQRFIKGDMTAMTQKQKLGATIFLSKGRCANCHRGQHLGLPAFIPDGIPQIGSGTSENGSDLGRYNLDEKEFNKYAFRILGLINLELTAPYMHNGAFATLEQVVEHYNDIEASLTSYDGAMVERSEFLGRFENNRVFIPELIKLIPTVTRVPLKLDATEKEALVEFLRNALLDSSYLNRL